VALTFINKDDMQKLHRIERLLQKEIPKMPLPPEVGVSPDFKSTKHSGSPSNRRNKSGKQKKVKSSK
jgi:superfamily II DNA/RNA helicase